MTHLRIRRPGIGLLEARVLGVVLDMLRVNASRGRVEHALDLKREIEMIFSGKRKLLCVRLCAPPCVRLSWLPHGSKT